MSGDGPRMQNLTPYFDFPPHIAYSIWYFLGAPNKIYGCLLVRRLMLKWNQEKILLSPDAILVVFRGCGQVVQNVLIFSAKGTSLPESASFKPFCVTISWGVWPPGESMKKAESHRTSHWNDVSPLTQGCTLVHLWLWRHNSDVCVDLLLVADSFNTATLCKRTQLPRPLSVILIYVMWQWLA